MSGWRERVCIAASMWLVLASPVPGWAQQYWAPVRVQTEGPAATPATFAPAESSTSPFSVLVGTNWASAYYWRGFRQTPNGSPNLQPYLELGVKLLKDAGPLSSLVIAPGIWTNWNDGSRTDFDREEFWLTLPYFKATATWWETLSTTVTYTYYKSVGSSSGLNEVGLGFGLNDAKWLGAFAFNPNLLLAFDFETEEALTGSLPSYRVYMGLGLAPGYTFFESSRLPVNISVPMTFGFSVKDFYVQRRVSRCPAVITAGFGNCVTFEDQNQAFGYFSGGPLISMPLKFIPASFGSWTLQGGVQFLALNSALAARNDQRSFVPIGSVGLSLTY